MCWRNSWRGNPLRPCSAKRATQGEEESGGDARPGQVERTRIEGHKSFIFRRNIVYYDRGNLLGRRWESPSAEFDHNLYWDASGRPVTFAGTSLKEWQAMGMDGGSLIADPLFANPKKEDFRLRPGSPAFRIGFEPFDLSGVGPRE